MVALLLLFMAFLVYAYIRSIFNYAPSVVSWFLLALLAGVSYLLYLNIDDLVSLWTGIKNLPDTVTTLLTDTGNEIRVAMTGWAWVACGLSLFIGMIAGGGASWASGRVLLAVQTRRLKRELEQARKEIEGEREKTKQTEQARRRDRDIIANVKRDDMRMSRQAGKDRGQRINAVGELKRRREREDKLRDQLADAHREIERLKRALPPESEAQ